jgi:hypothetical protein
MRAEAQSKARRANQQRPLSPSSTQPPPPLARQTPPTPRLEPTLTPLPGEVVEAQVVDRASAGDRRVREHLRGTEQIAEHARHLGEQVDQADDKLTAHLHQVFDHELGQLKQSGDQGPAKRDQVSPDALSPEMISRLLRSSTAARDAIVLAEILQRPEQRW